MSHAARATAADLHVFLVAGEESGDRLGAALMQALRQRCGSAVRFSGVGGAQMAAQGLPSLFPLGDLAIVGFAAIPVRLAENSPAHSRNRRCGYRRAPRRAGDHRQSGIYPPGRAPGARTRAGDPHRRLCLPLGLGLAAGPRARHARLYRSCAGAAAVRAGGAVATRRAALHLCRASAQRARRPRCGRMPRKRERRLADPPRLLVLPGSRAGEIGRMAGVFGQAAALLSDRIGGARGHRAGGAPACRHGAQPRSSIGRCRRGW